VHGLLIAPRYRDAGSQQPCRISETSSPVPTVRAAAAGQGDQSRGLWG